MTWSVHRGLDYAELCDGDVVVATSTYPTQGELDHFDTIAATMNRNEEEEIVGKAKEPRSNIELQLLSVARIEVHPRESALNGCKWYEISARDEDGNLLGDFILWGVAEKWPELVHK